MDGACVCCHDNHITAVKRYFGVTCKNTRTPCQDDVISTGTNGC